MENVLINGSSFILAGYYLTSSGIIVDVVNSTIADIEEASGVSTRVEIADTYVANGMNIKSITKEYSVEDETFTDLVTYRIEYVFANLKEQTEQNTLDIEVINNAIVELADIVGGGE